MFARTFITAFLALLILPSFRGATCVSTGNGAWNNSATWSCGSVPACGDSIVIQAGHTVSITANTDYSGCGSYLFVHIYGTLKFSGSTKLFLPCNSKVIIRVGGQVVSGGGNGNSNTIEICGNIEWNAGAGTYGGPGCMPPMWSGCAAALPVELTYFNAARCAEGVCLEWMTQVESNVKCFIVESSDDGERFVSLDTIAPGREPAKRGSKYAVTDRRPGNGPRYYRLKTLDLDMSYSYSSLAAVVQDAEAPHDILVYPNPGNGVFHVQTGYAEGTRLGIALYNSTGELVYSSERLAASGSGLLIDPGMTPPAGLYLCCITAGNTQHLLRLVIE